MPRRALALALLGLIATGCRPLRRLRRGPARHAAQALPHSSAKGLYTARPAEGPALRVRPGHYVAGALRRTDAEVASAPWPATALVAAAMTAEVNVVMAAAEMIVDLIVHVVTENLVIKVKVSNLTLKTNRMWIAYEQSTFFIT